MFQNLTFFFESSILRGKEERMKRTFHRYALGALLIVMTIALVATAGYRNISFSDIVLHVDGEEVEVHTDADTVQDVLHDHQIKLEAHDKVNYALDQKVIDGMNIEISRAVDITVIEGDKRSLVKTHEETVADVLPKLNTTITEHDIITPAKDTPITADMEITIEKVEYRDAVYERPLEYTSATVEDNTKLQGVIERVQTGKNGLIAYQVKEKLVNGEVVSHDVIGRQVVRQPVKEIIAHGTYVEPVVVSRGETPAPEAAPVAPVAQAPVAVATVAPAPAPAPAPVAQEPVVMLMTATAYHDVGITRSGVPSGPGKVAVDPNVIPLGTRLLIESVDGWPSYGEAIAADTGGAVIGNIIDLWYADYQTCINFGRRTVKVTILP